jgi:hypothetical protein
MNYSDINHNMTLPMRQHSLFNIIAAAQMAASQLSTLTTGKKKERISVIHAPLYVDAHVESLHVFCPTSAIETIYPKRLGMTDWHIDALVDPDGRVFFTRAEDALVVLTVFGTEQRRVSIEIEEER